MLIGFIVVQLTATGRTEIRIANNIVANSAAQAAADGAIWEAIFNLSDPEPNQRWPVNGNALEVGIGASVVSRKMLYITATIVYRGRYGPTGPPLADHGFAAQ